MRIKTSSILKILFSLVVISIYFTELAVALTITDNTNSSYSTYKIEWTDNDSSASIVELIKSNHANAVGVAPHISYYDGTTLVDCTPGGSGSASGLGFGSTCHHENSSHHGGGTLTLRFQGDHLAIFDWTHTIDNVPEAVTYVFMDGLDYFQWSLTSHVENGATKGDSRGPYCTMNWDGGSNFSMAEGMEYGAAKVRKRPTCLQAAPGPSRIIPQ